MALSIFSEQLSNLSVATWESCAFASTCSCDMLLGVECNLRYPNTSQLHSHHFPSFSVSIQCSAHQLFRFLNWIILLIIVYHMFFLSPPHKIMKNIKFIGPLLMGPTRHHEGWHSWAEAQSKLKIPNIWQIKIY